MKTFSILALFAAGAMIPVFCQSPTLARVGNADKPVHPGESICILVTLAEPDKEITNGGFVATPLNIGAGGTSIGSFQNRESDASVKLCGSFDGTYPTGEYQITNIRLGGQKSKSRQFDYPTGFKEKITFRLESEAKDVPAIKDVQRVPEK